MIAKQLQAEAVAAFAAGDDWAAFWACHSADVDRLEFSRARRKRLIVKLESLVRGKRGVNHDEPEKQGVA